MTEHPSIEWMADRLGDVGSYMGGVHGTCYECPFASAPQDMFGVVVDFGEVANDPTEAWFTCSLPGRVPPKTPEWGEYAPCTPSEWADAMVLMDRPEPETEKA